MRHGAPHLSTRVWLFTLLPCCLVPGDSRSDMNQTEYASYAGCTRQRVGQWLDDGLPCSLSGEIDPQAADDWREQNLEQAKRPTSANAEARLRKLIAEADLAEMKAQTARAILQPIAVIERTVSELAQSHRDQFFSFIARLAPALSGRYGIEQSDVYFLVKA
jgi:hypothetical protein